MSNGLDGASHHRNFERFGSSVSTNFITFLINSKSESIYEFFNVCNNQHKLVYYSLIITSNGAISFRCTNFHLTVIYSHLTMIEIR